MDGLNMQGHRIGLLTGHSYVRRLREAFGWHFDIQFPNHARRFATQLRVDSKFAEIYTCTTTKDTRHGAGPNDLKSLISVSELPPPSYIHKMAATHVVVDIATNDLAHCTDRDPQFVVDLAWQLSDWVQAVQRRVVVQAVLPHYKNIACLPYQFGFNQSSFNNNIRGRVEARTEAQDSYLRFNKMQGFGENQFQHLMHLDGIHVQDPKGKYLDRVRKSFLDYHW